MSSRRERKAKEAERTRPMSTVAEVNCAQTSRVQSPEGKVSTGAPPLASPLRNEKKLARLRRWRMVSSVSPAGRAATAGATWSQLPSCHGRRGLVAVAILGLLVRMAGCDKSGGLLHEMGAAAGVQKMPSPSKARWAVAAGSRAVNDEIMRVRSMEQLCFFVAYNVQEMDPVNINTAWRRLLLPHGKPERNITAAALPLVDRTVNMLMRRALSLLLRGQDSQPHHDASGQLRTFGPREMSNMLHALAKSGRRFCSLSEALVAAFEQRSLACIQEWNGQDIGNTLWAYATLRRAPAPPLLEALQGKAVQMARHFTAQQISNTLWAFATLKLSPCERLCGILSEKSSNSGFI